MAAPTLVDYQQSTFTDRTSASEVTASLTWQAGDLIVVVGLTENQPRTLGVPTASGLTFAPISGGSVDIASACHVYSWSAIAGSNGSGAITSTVDATIAMRGISAFVYRGHGGIGNVSSSGSSEAVSVRSLTRSGNNSAMVFALGNWTPDADVTVSPTPSGTERVAITQATFATMFVFDYGDQGAAGTANVGITGFNGVTNNVMVAIEIKGLGTAAVTGTATASITEADIVTGGKTLIATLTDDTFVAASESSDISYIANALGGTTTTTSFSVTLPTTQADDILILEFVHRGTGNGTIAGTSVSVGGLTWTLKHSQLFGSSLFSGKTYWTRATGNHAGQTVTGASLTDSCAAIVTQYRGAVSSGDPLADATIVGEQNASGNETQAQITTTTDKAWVVLVVVNSPDLAISTQNSTSPGTLTERAERLSTGGTDSSISHASAAKATAGATGNLTWAQTNAASGSWAYAITPNATTPFADARADVRSGIVSAQSEGAGFNARRDTIIALSGIERLADDQARVTFSADAGYEITAQEVLEWTLPASILSGGSAIVATPTITIDETSSGTITLNPSSVTASWSVPSPTVTLGTLSIGASSVVGTWSVPSVGVHQRQTVSPVVASWSVPAPGVTLSAVTIGAGVVTAAWTVPTPTVVVSPLSIAVGSVSAVWSIPTPNVALQISAASVSATWTVPAPSVALGTLSISVSPVTASWVVPSATIGAGLFLSVESAFANWTVPSPTVVPGLLSLSVGSATSEWIVPDAGQDSGPEPEAGSAFSALSGINTFGVFRR